MVDIVAEVTYPLDPTGAAASNKVGPERHTLTSRNWAEFNIIIPQAAPYFQADGLKLKHYPSGTPLVRGKDWIEGWYFKSATEVIGKHIYGCIVMVDPTMSGEIEIESYQTLGGEWTLNQQKLEEILAERLENPLRRYWEVIVGLPSIFPPLDHPHPVDDMSGLPEMLNALNGITQAILTAATGGGLPAHLVDFQNPHRTTKDQVGLSEVMNWAVATLADIAVGSISGVKYMNPVMTYEMIKDIALSVITAHVQSHGNVHGAVAGDFDAYTKEEIIELIGQLLRGELGTIDADLLEGENRAQILARAKTSSDSQIAIAKQQIIDQLSSIIEGAQATDTVRFDGKTAIDWENRIVQIIDDERMEMFHPKVMATAANPETGEPAWPRTDPTYTLLGYIQAAWDGVVKQDTAYFTFAGGNAPAKNTSTVIHGTINSDRPAEMILNLDAGPDTDSVFIYRIDQAQTLPTGDVNPNYGEGQLWVRSPVKRKAITMTVNSQETFSIIEGGQIIDSPDWVNNGTEVTIAVIPRFKNITDSVAAANTRIDTTNGNVTTANSNITILTNNLSTTNQAATITNQNVTLVGNRVTALEDKSKFLVSAQPVVAAAASVVYDLRTLVGANYALYDLDGVQLSLRVLDTVAGSVTVNQYIDAALFATYSINPADGKLTITNETTDSQTFQVRITVVKKLA